MRKRLAFGYRETPLELTKKTRPRCEASTGDDGTRASEIYRIQHVATR